MVAYLITWNPAKYDWEDRYPGELAKFDRGSRRGKTIALGWSCGQSKLPRRGDRVFLIKLGSHGRGIFASGWLRTNSSPAKKGQWGPRHVDFDCDVFLNPNIKDNLLEPPDVDQQLWTSQISGITIKPAAHAELEVHWARHLLERDRRPNRRETTDDDGAEAVELEALEGELRERLVLHRRRERALRDQKLAEFRRDHGHVFCEVCNFDFVATYGIDVEYAEVHHVKPLASSEKPRLTRTRDLAVLCANCHRVAHLDSRKVKSVAQLRAMLRT